MEYTIIVKGENGSIAKVISFDAITDFNKALTASVTGNTVESGYPISDSITLTKPKFDISAVVTGYNLFDDAYELIWNGSSYESVGGNVADDRHLLIQEDIEEVFLQRTVFSLLRTKNWSERSGNYQDQYEELKKSSIAEFDNCVMTSLSFQESAGVSGAVFPRMTIEQVSVAYVSVEKLDDKNKAPKLTKIAAQNPMVGASATKTSDGKTETGSSVSEKPNDPSSIVKGLDPEDKSIANNMEEANKKLAETKNMEAATERANANRYQGKSSSIQRSEGVHGKGWVVVTAK